MKSRTDFEQTRNAAPNGNVTRSRLRNTTKDLQQRTFPGAVSSYHTDNFSFAYFKRYILQSPKLFDLISLNDLPCANDVRELPTQIPNPTT